MCQSHNNDASNSASTTSRPAQPEDAFPWHLSVYDAHCHPTDTMSSIPLIRSDMRASALTIMATRSQDQQLVADVASDLSVKSKDDLSRDAARGGLVVPAFGWHPWFSHQIIDDSANPSQDAAVSQEAKSQHYRSVLTPSPDDAFIDSLPSPRPLSSLLSSISTNLMSHSLALVGEIGLDKAFRLPAAPSPENPPKDPSLTPGGREGRMLSPYRVKPEHQRFLLEAQLKLAGKESRAVSVHGVQAHGMLLDTVGKCWKGHEREVVSRRQKRLEAEGADFSSSADSDDESPALPRSSKPQASSASPPKPYPPRICLHSFSASPEVLRQWLNPAIPATIFFSFSIAVNAGNDTAREKLAAVVKEVPEDKILVESDLHIAGEGMDAALEEMYRFVCAVKGWGLEEGVRKMARNYEAFIFG